MTRFDICSSCRSRSRKDHNDMGFSCICGRTGLCEACATYAVCDECGNGCCKDCNFPLPCCGMILCGSGRDVHGGMTLTSQQEKHCFGQHKTTTTRPCGHYGCNFHNECLACNPESAPTVMQAAMPPVVTGPAENLAMYQASKRTAQVAPVHAPTAKPSIYEPPIQKASKHSSHNSPTFPETLHAMVTETAATQPNVISWIANGEAFKVLDPKSGKLGKVLFKHFNRKYPASYTGLGRISSPLTQSVLLYRQQVFISAASTQHVWVQEAHKGKVSTRKSLGICNLHLLFLFYYFYGHSYTRPISFRYNGAFQNRYFHRDRPEDLLQIHRRPPPNASSKKTNANLKIQSRRLATKKVAPQVLSPNRMKPQVTKHKSSVLAKHLPPKKRFSPATNSDTENAPSMPIINEVKEKFKAASGTRPAMIWSPKV